MANGVLNLSKWVEDKWLTYLVHNELPGTSFMGLFNEVWNSQIPQPPNDGDVVGKRVHRALLCTACNPNNISGLDYTELSAGGYPGSSNLNLLPHVQFDLVPPRVETVGAITFGPATETWNNVRYLIVVAQCYKESQLGQVYWTHDKKIILWHEFTPAITVSSGQSLIFPSRSFVVQMT